MDSRATVAKTDFKIVKVIGRGSFGKVYLVQHNILGTYHAMKSVKKERVLQTDQLDGIRSKFIFELTSNQSRARHPREVRPPVHHEAPVRVPG